MAALKSVPREVARRPRPPAASDVLSRFTHDLVERARRGGFDPVIGRDVEVRRLLQILERRYKNHPLLVGEAGVGKTAIVGALAMRIAAGDVPGSLAKLSLLELETGLLVAGAKLRGEIEERLRQVLAAVKAANRRRELLYVSGIDSLLGQGAAGSGVGDLLKPLLARGEVRLVASTTVDGARKMQERDPGLLRRFSVLSIEAPSVEQAIEILRGIASKYEAHHQVRIGEGAIVAAVRSPSATCRTGRSPTRRSICSTRPRRESASRSTACPPRSTRPSAAWRRSRRRPRRWPATSTR